MGDVEYAECIVSLMDHTLKVPTINPAAKVRNSIRRQRALDWLRVHR